MKLSINDFSAATSARIVEAVIEEVDSSAGTARVTMGSTTLVGVPVHYLCHHGLTTHIFRVFKPGDTVLMLYRGAGAPPSADNLVVVGLKDEIRRCRSIKGIRAFAYSASEVATFSPAVPYPVTTWYQAPAGPGREYFFDGVEAIRESTNTKHVDWSNNTDSLTWSWTTKNRYNGAAVGPSIYSEGVEYARAPGSVLGAAVKVLSSGERLIVAGVKESASVALYIRPADGNLSQDIKNNPVYGDNPRGWTRLGQSVDVFNVRSPITALCFSQNANNAVISNGQELCVVDVNFEQQTIESYVDAPPGQTWWPFADYADNSLVRATADFKPYSAVTEESDTGEISDGVVMQSDLIGTEYAHSIYTVTQSREYFLKVEVPFAVFNCHSSDITSTITTRTEWYRRTFDGGSTWGPWYQTYYDPGLEHPGVSEKSAVATGIELSDCIIDIDLRYDYAAYYSWYNNYYNSEVIVYDTAGNEVSRVVTRTRNTTATKICDGSILSLKSVQFNPDGTILDNHPEGYFHPSAASNGSISPYWAYYIGQGNSWPDSFQILPVGWLPILGYSSVINGAESRMTSWLHDPGAAPYTYYQYGDLNTLSGEDETTTWSGIDLV